MPTYVSKVPQTIILLAYLREKPLICRYNGVNRSLKDANSKSDWINEHAKNVAK